MPIPTCPPYPPFSPHVPPCPQQDGHPQHLSIHSWASFNTSAMPYHVQPHVLPHGTATVWCCPSGSPVVPAVVALSLCPPSPQAVTEVLRSRPAAVPVWWVVLGVLAGLLLLALLVLLMGMVSAGGGRKGTSLGTPGDTPQWGPGVGSRCPLLQMGFFKRTRPPAEGDTGEGAAEQGQGQGTEMGDGQG